MRTIRIYYNGNLTKGTSVALSEQANQHLVHVLRLKAGDSISLFNGENVEAVATVSTIHKKQSTVTISEVITVNRESSLSLHLYQSILRSDKMDWVIQKATELGVTKITPVMTQFSQVKLTPDRLIKRMDHWQGIIISACEQCGRNQLPTLNEPIRFSTMLDHTEIEKTFLFSPEADTHFHQLPVNSSDKIAFLIGPEGGFSPEEINLVKHSNITSLSLGPRILRTETAAITAMSIFQNRLGDLF